MSAGRDLPVKIRENTNFGHDCRPDVIFPGNYQIFNLIKETIKLLIENDKMTAIPANLIGF